MNAKHVSTLEYPKILRALSAHTGFSAGRERALALEPVSDYGEIKRGLEATSEARALLREKPGTSVGGARDVRPLTSDARRGKTLSAGNLLDVRDTLLAGRRLSRTLRRLEDAFPHLGRVAARIQPYREIIDEISRCIDEQGGVRDEASPDLGRIRREVDIAHDRIHTKLENIINAPQNASYLQDGIITQRENRYVIPVKAHFRDKIRGVVHDRSASGVTLFVEPLSVVDLNNSWRELQLEEEEEVRRILTVLSQQIGERADGIDKTVEALAELDTAFAKAKYAEAIGASAPELLDCEHRPDGHPGSTIRLLGARHPLLDPEKVVAIDVVLDEETYVLVITGPNTGGKTVSLKTVGLLTLMAQTGLHIPVEPGSALSPFDGVYADIGDEQSIEQSLSTFSAHITNIISFLDQADERSLVLLDELGAGTDPAEGSALARALLEHFRRRGSTTLVATHYPELKTYAQLTPGVQNASVEFDAESLSPTYRLSIGLPGRSNALTIAQRLSMPERIVQEARAMVSAEDRRTQDMLDDIHRLRMEMAQAREDAHTARSEAKTAAGELRKRLAAVEQERQEILNQARREAQESLQTLETELRQLRSRLRAAGAPVEAVTEVAEELDAIGLDLPAEPLKTPGGSEADECSDVGMTRPLHAGDRVWVRPLNAEGEVLKVDDGEVEVQVGPARTQVGLSALEFRNRDKLEPVPERVRFSSEPPVSPGRTIDLRGGRVEESLKQLDRYLDQAMRAGLPEARIIHGKGTGALRRAVRDFLANHPLVSRFEGADYREGGEGVTVADLVER